MKSRFAAIVPPPLTRSPHIEVAKIPPPGPPDTSAQPAADNAIAEPCVARIRLYDRQFYQVFAAVVLFMSGVALQYHFGQYIEFLGFGVDTLGRILSISMVGTLLIRLHIGRWIDRFGCRATWIVGSVVVATTVGSIQFAQHLWLIVVLRTLWTMAMAAVMTTVAVFAAQIAPPARRAEAIGTMGLAGFLGMLVGPTLGDLIFSGSTDVITPYRVFFTASALCSLLAGVVVLFLLPRRNATFRSTREIDNPSGIGAAKPGRSDVRPRSRSSQIKLIMEHWPGIVLLTGLLFSMVFCLQSLFLERLADARGFNDIKIFFLVYAPTAMILRVTFRHVPRRFGRSRTILLGSVLFSCGLLCLVGVASQWQLALPGFLMGAGHCFIFPSMVDLAADRFPFEYRGTGTAVILGAGDVGMLIGYVTLGELIDTWGFDIAIKALAAVVLIGAVLFGVIRREAVLYRARRMQKGEYFQRTG